MKKTFHKPIFIGHDYIAPTSDNEVIVKKYADDNFWKKNVVAVINNTGDTLLKGKIVHPIGGVGGLAEIEYADATSYIKSRFIGMINSTILNGETGDAILFGPVTGIDTSTLAVGPAYLDTDGDLTSVRPIGDKFNIVCGFVDVVDDTNGVIIMDKTISELTAEITDTNGFPANQVVATTIAFVNATRTFAIAPTGAIFHFYQNGIKYIKTTQQDIILPDVEGLYSIYFHEGVLTSEFITTGEQIRIIILSKCLVTNIYWDATNKKKIYFPDERHGISMSPVIHSYLHTTRGAQFLYGLGLDNFVIDASGDVDSHAQFSISAGAIIDEDLVTTVNSIGSTTGIPIYYLEGAELKRYQFNGGFPVLNAGTGRLAFNENVGGNWQLTEVINNYFVLYHIFAVNSAEDNFKIVAAMGQTQYNTLSSARDGAGTEISNLLNVLITAEVVPVGTVIYQTSDSYTNTVKAKTRTNSAGEDYTDWRTSEIAQGANPSSHLNLSNLQLAGPGITWGHINDQTQTIEGEKTFDKPIAIKDSIPGDVTAPAGESKMGIDDNLVPWVKNSGGAIKHMLSSRYNTIGITANHILDFENDNVIMCNNTIDITITIPNTDTITNDGIFREFFIFNLSSNDSKVNMTTSDGQSFIQNGLSSIRLNKNELFNFGAAYPNVGDGLATTATRAVIAQLRYNGAWSSASFTSATPVPFNTTDKEWDPNVIEHNDTTISRLDFKAGGLVALSYWLGINSTGGSTYNVTGYLRKNGTTIISGTELPPGNYGGEDQSLSIGVIYETVNAGDYIELMLVNTSLTGDANNIVLTAKMEI